MRLPKTSENAEKKTPWEEAKIKCVSFLNKIGGKIDFWNTL